MITELLHVGLSGAFLMLPPAASLRIDDPGSRSTLLPYGAATTALEPAPAGYEPVFVESLNRHGSRALSSPANVDNALDLWRRASAAGALTSHGKQFGDDVRELDRDNLKLGYGDLSALGAEELRGIGHRTALRLPGLLDDDARVDLRTSGVRRATESGDNFAKGLKDESPALRIGDAVVDRRALQFDHDDPDFQQFLADDRPTDDAIDAVEDSPAVTSAARSMLERVYDAGFVRSIDDPVSEARAIFGLYTIGAAMQDESDIDLTPYVNADEAAALSLVADAHYFYERGPGIEGRDGSFEPASVLLDDFFAAADERLAGGRSVARFRFGHAEQVIPLAALLGLPGSDQQAGTDAALSRDNNPWRGAEVSRLAANVQWIVYDNGTTPLVAMLYNERQIPFRDSCQPVANDSYLYGLGELKGCLR